MATPARRLGVGCRTLAIAPQFAKNPSVASESDEPSSSHGRHRPVWAALAQYPGPGAKGT